MTRDCRREGKWSRVGWGGQGGEWGQESFPEQKPQCGRDSAASFPQWERGEEWEAGIGHVIS